MNTTLDSAPITRGEFHSAITRIETILQQQTQLMQQNAVSAVENRQRDEKLVLLFARLDKLAEKQDSSDQKFNRLAGAGTVLALLWPVLAKKLGLM